VGQSNAFSETSDVLSAVHAFEKWDDIYSAQGQLQARKYARENGLSVSSLNLARGVRQQLRSALISRRFLPRDYSPQSLRYNRNSSRLGLKIALVCCAVPNLAHRVNKQVLVTRSAQNAVIHPTSVNFSGKGTLAAWYVYTEMTQTSNIFIRQTTAVSPIEVCLFGGSLISDQWPGSVVLDHWIVAKGTGPDIQVLQKTRRQMSVFLEHLAQAPHQPLVKVQESFVDNVLDILEEIREPTEVL